MHAFYLVKIMLLGGYTNKYVEHTVQKFNKGIKEVLHKC